MNGERIALPGNSMLDIFVGLLMGHFVTADIRKTGKRR